MGELRAIAMAVYVDDVRWEYRYRNRTLIMCHMWADTREELEAMARRIGLKPEWFQGPPKSDWDHYDIGNAKKELALSLGAVMTDKYGPIAHLARQRLVNGTPEEAAAAVRTLQSIGQRRIHQQRVRENGYNKQHQRRIARERDAILRQLEQGAS